MSSRAIITSQTEQEIPKVEKIVAYSSSEENVAVTTDIDITQSSGYDTADSPRVMSSAEDMDDCQRRDHGSTKMEV